MALAGLQISAQQQVPSAKQVANEAAPMIKKNYTGAERTVGVPVIPNSKKSVLAFASIGETFYDLQSNGSVDNRLQYDPATGQVSATWTGAQTTDPYTDRGTGYNFYNSTTWGAKPTGRVESIRVGWPSIVVTDTSEFIITHSGANMVSNVRTTPGFGSWTENTMFTSLTDGCLWPRAIGGGSNGKTVHVIAISTPVANSGTVYKGFDGALLYWRSLDGGFTWDIQDSLLPNIDTADHYGFSGDSYAIDASGNTVAIAVFNDFEKSFILKSTDNGDTWTRTVFNDNGFDKYNPAAAGSISDINNDGIADTISTSDNSGAVLIDNTGKVHVFYGRQRYLDDDPVLDANFSYFPVTNGIFYWNETSGPAQIIVGAPDLDNDGQLGITASTEVAQYFQSLSTFPNAGIDSDGDIFLSFSAINELEFSGTQFYNKIFITASRDGGATWENPWELTKDQPSVECVFPSLARTVDDKFRLLYQLDGEPGLTVRGDADPPGLNDIIFLDVDTVKNIGLTELDIVKGDISSIYPNPATTEVSLDFSVKMTGEYTIEITNIAGVALKKVELGNMASGNYRETVNIENLNAGVYIISLISEGYTTSKRLIIN